MPTPIYIVVTEDRHYSTDARPFAGKDAAIAYAEQEVTDNARHPGLIRDEDRELNEAMIADGWLWYCNYGFEGDSVRVIEREMEDAPSASGADEAWAAGYFDARGGYYFHSAQVMLIFTDKDREVLQRFARIIEHGWIRPVKNGTSFALQIGAQADIREVTKRFRPLVTRKKLIEKMDQALNDPRVQRASPPGEGPSRSARRKRRSAELGAGT